MTIKDILSTTYIALSKLSQNKLLRALQSLRKKYIELEKNINELKAENTKLKEALISQKIKSVNRNANKPSSKQPEWEKKEWVMMAKGRRSARGEGKSHEKVQAIVPRILNPTGQRRRRLIVAACVEKT